MDKDEKTSPNLPSSPAPKGTKRPAPPDAAKRPSLLKRLLLSLLMLGLIAAATVSVTLAFYINRISALLPSDEEIISYQANEASIVYDRKNREVAELYVQNRKPMKLGEFSKWMVMSILAAEDSEFYSHAGIRPMAILRSILVGDRGQGASTITQQLARNLFLTSEKSLERKAKEALISLRLEKLYSKDKLIETYLNAIYFGHGAWGIDAAAHSYFDKSASQLTLAESSILAGLIAAPEKYSPIRHPDLARARQTYVLNRLVKLGWITDKEAESAVREELKFNERTEENNLVFNKAPYFISHILFKELIPKYGSDRIYKSGMKIYTTLDLDLQTAAENAMKKLKSEGGLVAVDPADGSVLALVGGKDFNGTKFNRVTQAFRQTGSVFKPIVYASAIEEGYRPVDHIIDKVISLDVPNSTGRVWTPLNYGDTYAGEETLLSALAHSHNTPAVRLTVMMGPQKIVDTARRLGITSPHLTAMLSVGLGASSVTPLEMSVVYSAFANGGLRILPTFIREIRSNDDKVIYSSSPSSEKAIAPETALITRSMLQEVIRAGTGSRARMTGFEMFGKTGTTNDSTDAWFAGGVPGLVTVVYAGNDDLKPLGRNATGSQIALPVWSAFMKQAVTILGSPKTFPDVPADVETVRVCVESGYIASPACRKSTSIFLPSEKIPVSPCPVHGIGNGDETNAPQLLLLPQDKDEFGGQTVTVPGDLVPALPLQPGENVQSSPSGAEQLLQNHGEPTPGGSSDGVPSQKEPVSTETMEKTGSWRDHIKKDDRPVEERYQELLKKYNIK